MVVNARKSQDFVPIKEVRDGIIILKDGGLRAVLVASSINLSLKSYDEQQAVIAQFQSFLNGLDFPTQIIVQSRRLDIRPYLLTLEDLKTKQVEPLIKIQTGEYMDFIKNFTDEVNIMTKTFFVVVPYAPTILSGKDNNILEKIGLNKKNNNTPSDLSDFEEKRTQLDQRVGVIMGGLSRFGVRSTQLGTEEVVELFYKTFNPGDISQGIKLE